MVVKRKISCGSNGFNFPKIPKAPRTIRRKVPADDVEGQISAIDLLASLAGKLLEESESSSASTNASQGDNHNTICGGVKQEQEDVYNKFRKSEPASKSASENSRVQFSSLENDCVLEQTPVSGFGLNRQVGDCDLFVESEGVTDEIGVRNVDGGLGKGEATNGLIGDTFSLEDPSQSDVKFPGPAHVNRVPNDSKLVSRDDDEKYCKYYKYSDKCKSYRPLARVGNGRIKKSAMTKYGRAFPKSKCFEDARTDGYLRAFHRKRKLCYGYRKRRLSDKCSDGGLSSESVTNSPVKAESVKFSIKSFKIPELFIEVPETATVGSLKRTVMEAVTALLGDGIRIGVLVHGKKVRDDNNTLSQTGLSCGGNLGFTLEPGPETPRVPLCSEKPVVSMPTDSWTLSERSSASPMLDSSIILPIEDADHLIQNERELVPYKSDILAAADDQQRPSDSRALVPVPALEPEALAIVPLNEKPKRTELSQRRTRRPFSVTEVEALVQAVEELGTGRWRDVKLRSFENASHRTYVDLKDKWKTLVHTASISPQQRRGEPVPQVLLDRVLAAHNHWSTSQVKQSAKHQEAAATALVVKSGLSM